MFLRRAWGKLFCIPLVNANGFAVGIKAHRHAADRREERLHAELHVVLAQLFDGGVEIFHFHRGSAEAAAEWFMP